MLLRFSVTNHLSIHEEQVLSMVAAPAIKDDEGALIESPGLRGLKLVPSALIYGANASGKSNILDALAFMQRMVLDSHNKGEPGRGVPRVPFLLDPKAKERESRYELDFMLDDVRYQYGFCARDDCFISEWLNSWPRGSKSKLFERTGQSFEFGRMFKGRNHVIADLTRANSLFVSAAAQNGHEIIARIQSFFGVLDIVRLSEPNVRSLIRRFAHGGFEKRIISLLRQLDTGVIDGRIQTINPDEASRDWARVAVRSRNIRSANSDQLTFFVDDLPEGPSVQVEYRKVQLGHQGMSGPVFFDLSSESAGTLRLLSIIRPLFFALEVGGPIVIDELDSNLHTRACEAILELFASKITNPKGAQLIATTHDTNLLTSKHLRRDQIWFTEKNNVGETHLYPLTDIRTRKQDNIEKGYLQGRFGAIPFAGSIAELMKAG